MHGVPDGNGKVPPDMAGAVDLRAKKPTTYLVEKAWMTYGSVRQRGDDEVAESVVLLVDVRQPFAKKVSKRFQLVFPPGEDIGLLDLMMSQILGHHGIEAPSLLDVEGEGVEGGEVE